MNNILSLDMAIKTGWATKTASGVWDFNIRRDESSGIRLVRFRSKVREIVKKEEIDIIAFEAVQAGGGKMANFNAIKLGSKMQGIVEEIVEDNDGLECCSYDIMTIKKHAIPKKGKRDKIAMLAAARLNWPDVDIIDDNQADALWILDLAEQELNQ